MYVYIYICLIIHMYICICVWGGICIGSYICMCGVYIYRKMYRYISEKIYLCIYIYV